MLFFDVANSTLNSESEPAQGSAELFTTVFAALERANIPYCITHGYENFPQQIKSDIDCVVASGVTLNRVSRIIQSEAGVRVVRCLSGHIVVAGKNPDGSFSFLDLDVARAFEMNGRRFYSGDEVVANRRQHGPFWAPAVAIEFGCYLVRRIVKGSIDAEHWQRLVALYQLDPEGCDAQLTKFWNAATFQWIETAFENGYFELIQNNVAKLRSELLRQATLRQPHRVVGHWSARQLRKVWRYLRPQGGFDVIFLGPDGAGKSSVIREVRQELAGAFASTTCLMWPPALLRRLRGKPEGSFVLPHDLPPRSKLSSIIRAVGYWFNYYTFGYWLLTRPALARSSLVIHDRHMLDAIVDPVRYRYSGPQWLLRWIWRLIPKPDTVILLDAPAEVLQSRKQEVAFEVTARQAEDYRNLMRTLSNGQVMDASRPLREVVNSVSEIILDAMSRRFQSR